MGEKLGIALWDERLLAELSLLPKYWELQQIQLATLDLASN